MAEQFTFHWWDHVFNKAAASIEVEGTEEGAKVMGNRSDGAEEPISNRKPRKAHLSTTHALYGNFVKAATLTSGEEVRDEKESSEDETSSSEDEDAKLDLSSTTRMTDEQLLRACGGRTAHKGARHGVNMSAKLARLEQQEREFLSRWGGGPRQRACRPRVAPTGERQRRGGGGGGNGDDDCGCVRSGIEEGRETEEVQTRAAGRQRPRRRGRTGARDGRAGSRRRQRRAKPTEEKEAREAERVPRPRHRSGRHWNGRGAGGGGAGRRPP
nr:G patch domain-containing protein 4 isoform X2 [Petromyzon marinus]